MSRLNKLLPPLLLALAVFLFWWKAYPHALAYQEQFQLFLFDGDYLSQRLALPGGLARWLAELLVQFYNNPLFGALVLAAVFVGGYLLCARLTGMRGLSLLPVVLLWHAMGDENVLLTYAVALLLALGACCGLRSLRRPWLLAAVAVVGLPLLYWLIGPMALLPALYMAAVLPFSVPQRWLAAIAGLVAIAAVLLTAYICSLRLPFPPASFFIGLDYYRVPLAVPLLFVVIPLSVVLLAALQQPLKTVFSRGPITKTVSSRGLIAFLVVAAFGIWFVPRGFEAKKYELIDYDYLVRTGQWRAIIQKAEARQPDLPMSVAATNLALAMEGQLGERAAQFFQNGPQGLVPTFERNFATTQLTGEIYFRLGLVNTAQRLAFEAMEALPNYAKSVRVVRRLAETNIVNGQYAVARKYLKLLSKTLFYRRWAAQTAALLDQGEAAIDAHPVYGHLRRLRLADDFLFSERELDKIFGQLFLHNPANNMARQYLLLWPRLEGDQAKYQRYLEVVRSHQPGIRQ